MRWRPLAPGRYPFMGEFHSETRARRGDSRSSHQCWQVFLIVFREVIEAGLVVGIVLAATKGVPRRAALGRGVRWARGCWARA